MVKLFVGNLAPKVTPAELKKLFEQFGTVSECDVIRNYGFIHIDNEEEAKKAFTNLNNFMLDGRAIHLEYSTSKLRKAPGMDEVCFRCGDSGHKTNNCPLHDASKEGSKNNSSKRPLSNKDYSSNYPPAKRMETYYQPPARSYSSVSNPPYDYYARAAVEDPLLPRPLDRTLAPLYEDYLVARERYYYSRDRLERESRANMPRVGLSSVAPMPPPPSSVPQSRDYYASSRSPNSSVVRYPDVYYSRTSTGYDAYAIPSSGRAGYGQM